MSMASCMLHEMLYDDYCVEAILIAVYVLNRSPTTSLDDTIPQEVGDGKKVNVSNFIIFGSIAFEAW